MTTDYQPAASVLVIDSDRTWRSQPLPCRPQPGVGGQDRLEELLGGPVEIIPLTPQSCLCVADDALDRRQPANPLASALLGFMQLPIVQILGRACIAGYHSSHPVKPHPVGLHPVGLIGVQQRGFSQTLTTLLAMPDYLALHAQACRVSAGWARP